MVSPAAGLTAIKTIPTIELILIVGMVLYIDNEFYVIQILESFYVEIIIFPVIFDGQTPMLCPDYVHMLVEIPPSISVSYFVGYLKGKSTLMIFESHANLKYKYGNRHFWCRGYYVDAMEKMRRKYRNI